MSKNEIGVFLPTTQVWDSANIQETNVQSSEFKELVIKLYENNNEMAQIINLKDTGIYDINEFVCGQTFFPTVDSSTSKRTAFRQVYRKVINVGALLDTEAKSVAHSLVITDNVIVTRVYGASTDTTGHTYIPLPYSSPTLVDNIELSLDATNVIVTTGKDRKAYDTTYVVVEYLRN